MSIFKDIAEVLRSFPSTKRYELYCHPSVYHAIQQIAISRPSPFTPIDALYGADIIVASELGIEVWELYCDSKLIGYGRIRE